MSGQIVVYDHDADKVLEERRDHRKYVVKVATWVTEEYEWVATAGWDGKVHLYLYSDRDRLLGSPVGIITLPTSPEATLFLRHPDSTQPVLLVTCRDSTYLHYYALPALDTARHLRTKLPYGSPSLAELVLLGKQNLSPHSNAWIAFSPSSVAVSPVDSSLLAVATSAVPHMKLIMVRILWPPLTPRNITTEAPITQAGQMRADLALRDREDKAIQVHVSTLATQTPYSIPQVVWRPDGSGVWVNGDDGVLRGLEAKTGKIVATLRGGHEAGSKIRSIWCGLITIDRTVKEVKEVLVSGGFDRRLCIWG